MKVIIWGTGKFYQNRKDELAEFHQIEIIAFCDNDNALWGKTMDGIFIIPPNKIKSLVYDAILIMNIYEKEVQLQLLTMGIQEKQIIYWESFRAQILSGKRRVFYGKATRKNSDKRILIISKYLTYDGGSVVAVYAAMALLSKGYEVVLAIPDGEPKFIEEITNDDITVAICPALPYVFDKEKEWIKEFNFVLVNVFPMMQSAYASALLCPTVWWIHEATEIYGKVMDKPWNKVEEDKLCKLNIYAVSNPAKSNFNKLFSRQIKEILHYGIPDMSLKGLGVGKRQPKMIFAMIGTVCYGKAQDIFVEAIRHLNCNDRVEFWIIGYWDNGRFCEDLAQICRSISSIKVFGVLTREEIYRVFPKIDVVVCVSREDSLPIVMTEGMMFGKVCIASDKTGTADYIHDGVNGFVVPVEKVGALKRRMEWMINNIEKLNEIGKKARETYEKYFTIEEFGNNLEKVLLKAEKMKR